MPLKINDPSSLFGLNRLNQTHKTLSSSLEKLATGSRINRAADDASGMAIADALESQRKGYVQAIRNATDAISITQTADGAIGEMTSILQEIRTKAIQAASDSQSRDSRQALQADINRYLEGLDNIARTTSYNGQKLLTGQFAGKSFQVGAVSGETVQISIGDISLGKLGGGSDSGDGEQVSRTYLASPLTLQNPLTTSAESSLEPGSTLTARTELAAGSSLGFALDSVNLGADISTTGESALAAGSTLGAGSVIAGGTELGGTVTLAADTTTSGVNTIATGSTLATGTILAAGTVLSTDITSGGTTYSSGQPLAAEVTLTQDAAITAPLHLGPGSSVAAGSSLAGGSAISGNITLAATATMTGPAVLKSGSIIADAAGTNILSGSSIGGRLTLAANTSVIGKMTVAAGSEIEAGSLLGSGSSVGGPVVTGTPFTLDNTMHIGAGSLLESGSVLKAGTVLGSGVSVAGGQSPGAGTVLTGDVVTEGRNYLDSGTILAKGSTLASGSTIAPQTSPVTTAGDSRPSGFSRLAEIDVTSMEGAQAAIGAVDEALSQLNRTRSGLGSTQNQLVSSITNLSVTMANTAAAGSTIADLDFAEESTLLNNFQILLKAQVFAQAQTNRIRGSNVMSLLQG
ncbi:MAG: hypothetical protein KKG47_00670 [Proteobacteria bacterium]|nr:hypothetical protein [Pseudomonadota bacterium]MBU1737252.1 hypothetical protein [Pseudomonadota bacterium]